MEVGRLIPDWFRILVGDTMNYSDKRMEKDRPTETVEFIVYRVENLVVSSMVLNCLLEEGMKSGTRSEIVEESMEEIHDKQYATGDETFDDFISTFNEITMEECDPYTHEQSEIRASDSQPIPRFGEWDNNDPASSENYTHIFNRIRSEGIVSKVTFFD
ncbi:hypothetical protein L1987_01553 [Smallanthus sonchifolius]|uniref:Uncharacterized protein n=1 Tax=Smallanthus sonchifolius TaxID=185202 RepID=A0ACB9K5D8_9ASTR|nr:hypothetical protein L1987_01553 [Smallanthus sonchifolius]